MDVHWTGGLDSGTSLVSEGGMSNGHLMDIHWTGGLNRTVGQAWSVRVGCPMDIHWTGGTIPSGQSILMANLDMSAGIVPKCPISYTLSLLSIPERYELS